MELKNSILKPFIKNPHTLFHIREVSRLTGISHTAVRRYLAQLEKEGYIVSTPSKPYDAYKANTSSKAYRNLKLYYNLEQLRISKLIEFLEKSYEYPVIVLFGSYARTEDDEKSDIDLCIISEAKPQLSLTSYEKKLGRKISIHHFDKQRWLHTKKTNPELINSICNGLVLSGQLEVL